MTTTAPTSVATTALRRVPVQGRSVARVQRMLDACAEIVDEVGYEGLTTTLLAERAGVAIGSVYQFFPDKRAVVQALAERCLATYLERLTERSIDPGHTSWWDGVAAGIDEYVHMHRTVPGFRTLNLATDSRHDHNAVITGRIAEVLATRFDVPESERLRLALAVAVETADALIKFAFRRNPDGDEQILTEVRSLIREYLHKHVK